MEKKILSDDEVDQQQTKLVGKEIIVVEEGTVLRIIVRGV